MATKVIASSEVEVNDEGFFVDPEQWTEEMAPLLAAENGVPTPLTDQHWTVIRYMRSQYFENGTGPTVRKLGKSSGVTTTSRSPRSAIPVCTSRRGREGCRACPP